MKIDSAGVPFIALAAVPAAVSAAFGAVSLAGVLLILPGAIALFFRDPDRTSPGEPRFVLAPADGRVMFAGDARPEECPSGAWQQVTIFLSLLDVHINRTPVAGRVTRVEYRAGGFLPAYRREAYQNEQTEIWLDHGGTPIVARQVVGVLARRIVCRVKPGDDLLPGARIGLMKFGSRMDVFVPRAAALRVKAGDTVRAGVTVIAELGRAGRVMANLFDQEPRIPGKETRRRRGVFLLPSLFTVGNLFCGYACIVYSMSGQLELAAPFIGIAIVLDMLDGRIARLTNTTSAFGVEFDSLADVISFGAAPAVLAFEWGLKGQGQIGWAAGFVFLSASAIRLARFNTQTSTQVDKRYFVGMPTPAAAGIVAATVYALPNLPDGNHQAIAASAAVAVMLVPGALMVSTIRFRSFKNINFGWGRSYLPLLIFVLLVALVATHRAVAFLILAYGYLIGGFVETAITRMRGRRDGRSAPLP